MLMNLLKTMTGNSVEKQYCYEAVKPEKKAILCNSQMCSHVVLPILSWLFPVGITRKPCSYVSVILQSWNEILLWDDYISL